jgi:lysophospholipase L1-like esterase
MKRILKPFPCYLFLFTCLISGCSEPPLKPLKPDAVILAFGDSLTAGVGVTPKQSYPNQLAAMTGLHVINAGVSGETTGQGLPRLEKLLAESNDIDLIVLLEGGNDILRNLNLQQSKNNLAAMIQLASDYDIPVVLLGVPKKALFSKSADMYYELSEEFQLVFDAKIIASLIKDPSMKSDSVHFNQKGYQALAESVFELLRENGAIDD